MLFGILVNLYQNYCHKQGETLARQVQFECSKLVQLMKHVLENGTIALSRHFGNLAPGDCRAWSHPYTGQPNGWKWVRLGTTDVNENRDNWLSGPRFLGKLFLILTACFSAKGKGCTLTACGHLWTAWRSMVLVNSVDKNHTSLGPHRISVICGFVFTSDQICSEDYLANGSMVGTYFSHVFGVNSCVFGVYPRAQKLSLALHQMLNSYRI